MAVAVTMEKLQKLSFETAIKLFSLQVSPNTT